MSSNNFAIIGKGFIFDRHKTAIESLGGKVLMTCDINPDTKPDFTDWVKMFASPEFDKIDSVSILTPNYLHSVMVKEALKRGKRVLCEKPLSINGTEGIRGVKTVLQLRHHPALKDLTPKNVHVDARMFRDDSYWNGWKGQKNTSGGILFNLGVHYIDLLIFLLGNPKKILKSVVTDRLAYGDIEFEKGIGTFNIEIVDNRERQSRRILVDGKEILLSNHDNLSYEDLHKEVYKEFFWGKGIEAEEAEKSLNLIHELLK
jgi:UDP-N-acetyl-2-amino-2-deoxyglucuronate dehydrogenase